eukprot:sb/3469613/
MIPNSSTSGWSGCPMSFALPGQGALSKQTGDPTEQTSSKKGNSDNHHGLYLLDPFFIVSCLHSGKVIDATPTYALFSIIFIPLNSLVNPLIYNKTVEAAATKLKGKVVYYIGKLKTAPVVNEDYEMREIVPAINDHVHYSSPANRIKDSQDNPPPDEIVQIPVFRPVSETMTDHEVLDDTTYNETDSVLDEDAEFSGAGNDVIIEEPRVGNPHPLQDVKHIYGSVD